MCILQNSVYSSFDLFTRVIETRSTMSPPLVGFRWRCKCMAIYFIFRAQIPNKIQQPALTAMSICRLC